MRPDSMILFDRLYYAIMAFAMAGIAINLPVITANIGNNNPGLDTFGPDFVYSTVIAVIALGLAMNLLLWYFISRRASNVARWIWVVLIAIGLVRMVWNDSGAVGLDQRSGALWAIVVISLALQIAAVIVLFRQDSRAWFANRGKVLDADVFS